jgi:hypothetical protein
MGWLRLDWSGSGHGPVEDSCEYGTEHSGSTVVAAAARGEDEE